MTDPNPWRGRKAQPTGYALENPDPVPAHLRGRVADRPAAGPGARGQSGIVRDLPLRLALIQAGVITTEQIALAEAALGAEFERVTRDQEEPGDA